MRQDRKPRNRPDSRKWILHGEDEPIFTALPQTILANLSRRTSESALVWNAFYPLLARSVTLEQLAGVPTLAGGSTSLVDPSPVEMFFWGHSAQGEVPDELARALEQVDGRPGQTEIDLLLRTPGHWVAIEAKRGAAPGRCGRYLRQACPEIHRSEAESTCRYWDPGPQAFPQRLAFGVRPVAGGPQPACARHYQLARTLMVVEHLGHLTGRNAHLWLTVPRARWMGMQLEWQDFADRVLDEGMWRRLRVIAWEDLLGWGPLSGR
jgi:hypothetical protein